MAPVTHQDQEHRFSVAGIDYVAYGGRVMPAMAGGAPVMTIEELETCQAEITSRLQEIDREASGSQFTDALRSEWDNLEAERERNKTLLEELRYRRDRLQAIAGDESRREEGATFQTGSPGATRGEDIWDLSTIRASVASPEAASRELRDRASRAIEGAQFPHERANRESCQAHMERLLETIDTEQGDFARRILQTGSPIYRRAFGKKLAGRPLSHEEERALSLTGADGGFAVPYTLDPTVIPTSDFVVNPYRRISRVEQIIGNEWRGVTSDGVSAAYVAEGTEASDDSPTLAQPVLNVERAQSFVPYSIEIGMDWAGLLPSLATLLQDAKDVLEAEKFTKGAGHGSQEPEGVITGATITTAAAGTAAFATEDLYTLEEALPPRFRARAHFLANRFTYNKVRQFDVYGGAPLWVRLGAPAPISGAQGSDAQNASNTGAELLGYPADEVSEMDAALTTGKKILVLGDFRYFLIIDRIGMNVEMIPHIFGSSHFPTGQRGLYAYWRNTSQVLSANAFRVLHTG